MSPRLADGGKGGGHPPGPCPGSLAPPCTRDEVAECLLKCRDRLRARIVRTARRAGLDVDDILSSAFRRIDLAFLRGVIRCTSEQEWWAFAAAVVDNATLDRLRRAKRERNALEEYQYIAEAFSHCSSENETATTLYCTLMSLENDLDRELMYRRLQG